MSVNIRIDPAAHARLAEVARAQHIPLTEALTRAIETYRREQLIQQMSNDYAALRADAEAWAEERAERALWDRSNLDGLDQEPSYPLEEVTNQPRAKASPAKKKRARR